MIRVYLAAICMLLAISTGAAAAHFFERGAIVAGATEAVLTVVNLIVLAYCLFRGDEEKDAV